MDPIDFDAAFKALTGMTKPGEGPFPWQRALYERFVSDRPDNIPSSCNLPTGLGKTSVIAVWLIALANGANVPRRLVYVVNRRTVVDQTTAEVESYRKRLCIVGPPWPQPLSDLAQRLAGLSATPDSPLAISTLRGQFADNREWSADPSRPAVICGTVDMIGSRLLFSGYGCGFRTRPLHAGFLGQDALVVHDEAHLEPAFQELLLAVEKEQRRCNDFRPLRVMELTATSRAGGEAFGLTDDDRQNETVQQRVNARKKLHLSAVGDDKKRADDLIKLALSYKDHEKKPAVLVFARAVDDVFKIVEQLRKQKLPVQQLTGTLRGWERDGLVRDPIFARFLPPSNRPEGVKLAEGTVYLVCTSAGEVGVNISADHLVCDLSTFDSMAQRFGRVNRFGLRDDTEVHVVHPKEADWDDNEIDARRQRTLALLKALNGDASPAALGALDPKARQAAFAPAPTVLPTSDILFDAWALTSVRDKLPGRPPVEPYLHGESDYDPPETAVAWREEVKLLTPAVLAHNKLTAEEALDLFPLKPHETLRGPTFGRNKVFEQLECIAARDAQREPEHRHSAWVVEADGTVTVHPLAALVAKDKQNKPVVPLGGRTVLLPPAAGGLANGLLNGDEPHTADTAGDYDVGDRLYRDAEQTQPRRARVWADEERLPSVRKGMRLVRTIVFPAADEDAVGRSWLWFERPAGGDDEGSKTSATAPVTWDDHTNDVVANIARVADRLGLAELRDALVRAARFHDLGKKREVWQRSIGNPNPKEWYAKSGRGWTPRELTDYRHEFGSLVEKALDDELKDDPHGELILHLIAAHHGRGRPHFAADEAFDPDCKGKDGEAAAERVAREVPQRFARLQRKYGRWGLAYLESLLRAADYAASANPTEPKEGQ